MIKRFQKYALAILLFLCAMSGARARAEPMAIELLLPDGMLYTLSNGAYRAWRLPAGCSVLGGAYSPDFRSLALVLRKRANASAMGKTTPSPDGPLGRRVRLWTASTRLIILERQTGVVRREWTVPSAATQWSVEWTTAARVQAVAYPAASSTEKRAVAYAFDVTRDAALRPQLQAPEPSALVSSTDCPRTLAETMLQGDRLRFTLEAAGCSTPPEPIDVYRLVEPNEQTHRDRILWEYHVTAGKTACAEPYACYTGAATQFLSAGHALFLAWDADLYTLTATDDGLQAKLVTQLLPQYSHLWGIASGETQLNALDVESKTILQPVSTNIPLPSGGVPVLYAQNFCRTRSFDATVVIDTFKKNLMIPAGYQVGPMDIDSFKDVEEDKTQTYTPLLTSVTWTSFHQISEPVFCEAPYTLTNATAVVISIQEDEQGAPKCQINFQDNR